MKAILFALVVTGLVVFASYRAMTVEPDAPVSPSFVDYGGMRRRPPSAFTPSWTATTGRGCSAQCGTIGEQL